MKSVYTYLTEKSLMGKPIKPREFNATKTKELEHYIPMYGHGHDIDFETVVQLLQEGAEPNENILGLLMTHLASSMSFAKSFIAKKVLLYIKDNYNISDYLGKLTQSWTIPQKLFGSTDIPVDNLRWVLENGFVKDIDQENGHGHTLMGFVVTSATRRSNDQKKAIDLLLQHGANINSSSFIMDHVSKKAIRDYLISKGRTTK